ncbi:uncharacterized protein LOC133716287 [Rosa rugosa]|uniref:uncharacterized protein LOC133716287 n=1 Tax=Rosa rugosa TaxID=74645 RepID=UPI002B416DDA|nr:uncharacterized protein LOC133716287 [Rosa rugosa]
MGDRLKLVAFALKKWEREKFGSVRRVVKELREELDNLQRLYPSAGVLLQRKEMELKSDKVLEKEEIMWCQRSRVNWLKHGDRNTKFFHNFARQRGSANKLVRILGEDNRWRSGQVDVGCVFVNYFRQLFTTGSSELNMEVLHAVEGRVPGDHATRLSCPFTRSEIERALKDMFK